MPETEAVALNEKQKKIADEIDGLSVLELAGLVKHLEEKYGVSAQAAVAVAVPGGGVAGGDEPLARHVLLQPRHHLRHEEHDRRG